MDHLPSPEDRYFICNRNNFIQLVGDNHDRGACCRNAADCCEEPGKLSRSQYRCWFIQEEDFPLSLQGFQDFETLLGTNGLCVDFLNHLNLSIEPHLSSFSISIYLYVL